MFTIHYFYKQDINLHMYMYVSIFLYMYILIQILFTILYESFKHHMLYLKYMHKHKRLKKGKEKLDKIQTVITTKW